MKKILLMLVGAGALGFGVAAYYVPSMLSREDAFANRFLASIEETASHIWWPATMLPPQGNDAVKVPILVYHSIRPPYAAQTKMMRAYNVAPEEFVRQLQYLNNNAYHVISFDVLVDHFATGAPLPEKPVILTFDDGWANQYRYAFPILQRLGFTGTFFIYTNAIGKRHFVTWQQVKEMAKAGMTIGAHTKSHPYLISISADTARLRDEIIGGKKVLEEHLGAPVKFFAYPFGHYNDVILSVIREAGFKAVRSTYPGVYQSNNDIYTLHGNEVTNNFDQFVRALDATTIARTP